MSNPIFTGSIVGVITAAKMAKRGRKSKPTELKRSAGNPGKRRLNPNEPKLKHADLKAPKGHLPRVGRELWNRLARCLDRSDLLTELDRQAQ